MTIHELSHDRDLNAAKNIKKLGLQIALKPQPHAQ
jgi:transposase